MDVFRIVYLGFFGLVLFLYIYAAYRALNDPALEGTEQLLLLLLIFLVPIVGALVALLFMRKRGRARPA